MTRPLAALLLAPLLGTGAARADGFLDSGLKLPTLVSLSWEAVVPQGDLRSFIDETSLRGLQLELGYGVARHLSLGVSASWSWLAQSVPTDSLQLPDGVITGAAYHRLQLVEFRGTFQWYVIGGSVQPWVGAGLGGGWHGSFVAVADQVQTANSWHAAVEPRAGLLWTFHPGLAVTLEARYVFSNATIGGARDARWLAIDLGLAVY